MGASFCSTVTTVSMKSRWAAYKSEFPFSEVCPFPIVRTTVGAWQGWEGRVGKEDGKAKYKEEGRELREG